MSSPALAAAKQPAPAGWGGSNCGGQRLVAANGATRTCTFNEDFSGWRLDRDKWTVTETATSGYRVGPECYVDSPNNVSVGGGSLHLTVRRAASEFTCADPVRDAFRTSYTSGMVSTRFHFSQTGGHFAIRARFPNVSVPGLHSALWMWPDKLTYGPASGEIDIAEAYSVWPGYALPSIPYVGLTGVKTTGAACKFGDLSRYHLFELEWGSTSMTFSYDGIPCWTTGWQPLAPLVSPQPFDKPFYVVLTQALGTSFNSVDPSIRFPVTMDVDYVRAWR